MRHHVLLECDHRTHPLHVSVIDADDDDQARLLVAEKWPGEDGLLLVRQNGDRLTRVPSLPGGG
jgi:hypothetical protein